MTNLLLFASGCLCTLALSLPCPSPPLLISATDELVDWFLFWYNYQNFCCTSCKHSLGKEGEATGVTRSIRDAALVLQRLLQAGKPRDPTTGQMFTSISSAAWLGTSGRGMGRRAGKGVFQGTGSRRLYPGSARSKRESGALRDASFVACSSRASLLLSSAKGLEYPCTRKLS